MLCVDDVPGEAEAFSFFRISTPSTLFIGRHNAFIVFVTLQRRVNSGGSHFITESTHISSTLNALARPRPPHAGRQWVSSNKFLAILQSKAFQNDTHALTLKDETV